MTKIMWLLQYLCLHQFHSMSSQCAISSFCHPANTNKPSYTLYWSSRLARSHYIVSNWLCLSVPLSLCRSRSLNCFFFVSRWNRAIFWPSVLHVINIYQTLFLDFWFRPPNAQNLLPQICTKSPISQLVWQIDRRCLGLLGGFRGWPIQWNHAKCCGADPCSHDNEIYARHEIQSPTGLITFYN